MKKTASVKKKSPAQTTVAKGQNREGNGESKGAASSRWTFLTNHAHVLICLHMQPDMVLREVAIQVGITERAVQRIVHDLEEEGFIVREKKGRRNEYKVDADRPLRHPIEQHRNIGDLLALISEHA